MGTSFVDTIREIRGGSSIAELTEQLVELVAAVKETGRAGKLTYTLLLKPASKGDGNVLMVSDQLKVAKPTLDRAQTVFFVNNDNGLQRNDPRQIALPGLRVLDHPTGKDAAANE